MLSKERPKTAPRPHFHFDIQTKTYEMETRTKSLLDVRLSGSLQKQAQRAALKMPPPKPGEKTFVRKIEYDSDWLARERARPPYKAPYIQTQASAGWQPRMAALALLEKKPFGAEIEYKYVKPGWEG